MKTLNRFVRATQCCFFTLIALAQSHTWAAPAATHQGYAYENNKTYVVNTALGIATQIVVSRDEKVLDFGTGFSAGWELVRRENIFYIKPKDPDAETNMYIRTDKRSYVLDLRIVSKDWKKISDAKAAGVNYVVQFTYPGDAAQQLSNATGKYTDSAGSDKAPVQEIVPSKISSEPTGRSSYFTNYEVAADMSAQWLVPARIYDDGAFMYLQFTTGVNSPAVFARSSIRDQEYVVNKTASGDSLQIVHGIHPVLVIRHGDSVVAIRRKD
jgi:type IV secretion system protein VirB9